MRKLLNLMALFVVSILMVSMVSAVDATQLKFGTVKVDGDEVTGVLAVEEGQTLEIRVGLDSSNLTGADNIQVEAQINGYEYSNYDKLSDSTPLFDLAANTTKHVDLKITLPKKLDKDSYLLRLRVVDKNGAVLSKDVTLAVEPKRHGIEVQDVFFSPGTTLKAGKSLLATVLLQNYGDKNEKDVKVKVEMPELGVSATEVVDVDMDQNNVDYKSVPEMFLPIPATAAAGDYQVKVTATFNDLRDSVTKTYTVKVLANEAFQTSDKLVLAVGPETQAVTAGQTAMYGIALTNAGSVSKAYVLETATGGWATAKLSDSLVVLEPGKNKVVYVELTPAADAAVGEHVASVTVKSGKDVLETVALKGSVAAAPAPAVVAKQTSTLNLRNGLEIALIILVVLLVVIGLIIGFSRLKKDDEEDKTYY
jgi:uncharacterized membrane protein